MKGISSLINVMGMKSIIMQLMVIVEFNLPNANKVGHNMKLDLAMLMIWIQ